MRRRRMRFQPFDDRRPWPERVLLRRERTQQWRKRGIGRFEPAVGIILVEVGLVRPRLAVDVGGNIIGVFGAQYRIGKSDALGMLACTNQAAVMLRAIPAPSLKLSESANLASTPFRSPNYAHANNRRHARGDAQTGKLAPARKKRRRISRTSYDPRRAWTEGAASHHRSPPSCACTDGRGGRSGDGDGRGRSSRGSSRMRSGYFSTIAGGCILSIRKENGAVTRTFQNPFA